MAGPGARAPRSRGLRGSPVLAALIVTAVFGWALFSVNQLILDNQRAAYETIRFIKGTFAPLADAQRLYVSGSVSKALDAAGKALPDVATDRKFGGYDTRIMQQAEQERLLKLPATFRSIAPNSQPASRQSPAR
jgi:hypothetical protein